MQRIDLTQPSQQDSGSVVLYRTGHSTGPLLLCVERTDADDFGRIDQLAEALIREGWSVLHVRFEPTTDLAATAARIVDALARAAAEQASASATTIRVIAIAATTSVPAALAAVLASHQQSQSPAIAAIVTVDSPMSDAEMAHPLAAIDGFITLTAAYRPSRQSRDHGLALHRYLQSLDRDSHFMVLAESDRPLSSRLSDPRDPLGSELRRLLDPVNSRGA
jgi:hypothetical protein